MQVWEETAGIDMAHANTTVHGTGMGHHAASKGSSGDFEDTGDRNSAIIIKRLTIETQLYFINLIQNDFVLGIVELPELPRHEPTVSTCRQVVLGHGSKHSSSFSEGQTGTDRLEYRQVQTPKTQIQTPN